MSDENQEAEVQAEEVVEVEAEAEIEAPAEETVDDVKARLAKAEELANNYKIRAEKAEKKAKEAPVEPTEGLASKDVIYLAKADIHQDDVDEVLEIARAKKISVGKAHEYLKPILAVRAEQRTTAQAANVGPARRGAVKQTDEALLADADKGKLPDDDDGIARLIAAKSKKQ